MEGLRLKKCLTAAITYPNVNSGSGKVKYIQEVDGVTRWLWMRGLLFFTLEVRICCYCYLLYSAFSAKCIVT